MPWLRRVRSPYRTRAQPLIIHVLSMWVVIERLYVRVNGTEINKQRTQ